jgi:hypothetical protein
LFHLDPIELAAACGAEDKCNKISRRLIFRQIPE